MAIGRVNVGGGSAKLNVYTQLAEPVDKEGIWLQTNDFFKDLVFDVNPYLANAWMTPDQSDVPTMPAKLKNYAAVVHKEKIYFFGGMIGTTVYTQNIYVFDLKLRTWSIAGTLAMGTYAVSAFSVGDYIYIAYQSGSGGGQIIKFDPSTATAAASVYNSMRGTYGDRFVMFNGKIFHAAIAGTVLDIAEFDIVTNKWTTGDGAGRISRLVIPEYNSNYAATVVVGSKIYFIGGNKALTPMYTFDMELKTWDSTTHFNSAIAKKYVSAIVLGSKIYCLGGTDPNYNSNIVEVYDILAKTWTSMPPMPAKVVSFTPIFMENRIYVFGGLGEVSANDARNTIFAYSFNAKPYENNEIVVQFFDEHTAYKNQLSTQLFESAIPLIGRRLLTFFINVWLFKNGDLLELPSYYGDGTKWIKFKNQG